MRTNVILIGLLAVVFGGCTSPGYLPSAEDIDVNEHGSYVILYQKKAKNIRGELIAIDNDVIVVLLEKENTCVAVPVSEVNRFSLRYAKPVHYAWTIPVYTLSTLMHGFILILTAPLNLIVTIAVTLGGETAFRYDDSEITYWELKMFARYPQGIPPNIDMASISRK